MTFVIDTSIIVKWFVSEEGHEEAIKLLESKEQLVCPDFALAEAANALWRKTRKNEINVKQAAAALEKMPNFFDEIVPCSKLLNNAFSLAQKLDHSVYDCLFLSAASRNPNDVLITDDLKFAKKCVAGGFADKLRLLKDEPILFELSDSRIKKLLELLERYDLTKEFVKTSVLGNPKERKLITFSLRDMIPAFESPNYLRLKQKIGQLDEKSARSIIAICWYGREIGSLGFDHDYENAQALSTEPLDNAPYIIGLLRHYELGLLKLKQTHPQYFKNKSSN